MPSSINGQAAGKVLGMESDPEQAMERDADELEERLDRLDEHIDDAKEHLDGDDEATSDEE
jgi:hypothetical protein